MRRPTALSLPLQLAFPASKLIHCAIKFFTVNYQYTDEYTKTDRFIPKKLSFHGPVL